MQRWYVGIVFATAAAASIIDVVVIIELVEHAGKIMTIVTMKKIICETECDIMFGAHSVQGKSIITLSMH